MKSRLHESYSKQTVPALMKRFNWTNSLAVPKLKKITVNIGLGEASQNASCWTRPPWSSARLPARRP